MVSKSWITLSRITIFQKAVCLSQTVCDKQQRMCSSLFPFQRLTLDAIPSWSKVSDLTSFLFHLWHKWKENWEKALIYHHRLLTGFNEVTSCMIFFEELSLNLMSLFERRYLATMTKIWPLSRLISSVSEMRKKRQKKKKHFSCTKQFLEIQMYKSVCLPFN